MRGSNYRALTGTNLVFWLGGRLREVVAHGGSCIWFYQLSSEGNLATGKKNSIAEVSNIGFALTKG